MSISDMKRYIAEKLETENDTSKLDKIIHLLEEPKKLSVEEIFEEMTSKYDGLMKRLAQ